MPFRRFVVWSLGLLRPYLTIFLVLNFYFLRKAVLRKLFPLRVFRSPKTGVIKPRFFGQLSTKCS